MSESGCEAGRPVKIPMMRVLHVILVLDRPVKIECGGRGEEVAAIFRVGLLLRLDIAEGSWRQSVGACQERRLTLQEDGRKLYYSLFSDGTPSLGLAPRLGLLSDCRSRFAAGESGTIRLFSLH